MRKINTSNITPSIGMPVKSGSLDLIFDSIKEASAASIISRIINSGNTYSASVPYILSGINWSAGAGILIFTEGYVLYNGEIFYSPAQSISGAPNPTATVADIETVNITGTNSDPVQFFGTGAGLFNVHENRRVRFRGGSNPTLAAYTNFKRVGTAITTTAHIQVINFRNDLINLDDVQSNYSSYVFTYDFKDARVGAKISCYLGTPSGGTTFTFPVLSGNAITLINGKANGFSVAAANLVVIELTYLGKDSYNTNLVSANVYT